MCRQISDDHLGRLRRMIRGLEPESRGRGIGAGWLTFLMTADKFSGLVLRIRPDSILLPRQANKC